MDTAGGGSVPSECGSGKPGGTGVSCPLEALLLVAAATAAEVELEPLIDGQLIPGALSIPMVFK